MICSHWTRCDPQSWGKPMRRREFITLFGGTVFARPIVASAQQAERVRRIGVLMGYAESDSDAQANVAAFRDSCRRMGRVSHQSRYRQGYAPVPGGSPEAWVGGGGADGAHS